MIGACRRSLDIKGVLAASYIGGGVNFVATSQAVNFADSSLYVATLSADSVGAVFFLLLLMSLPVLSFARRAMPSKSSMRKTRKPSI